MDHIEFNRFLDLPAELRLHVYNYYFDLTGEPNPISTGSYAFRITSIDRPRMDHYPRGGSLRRWSDIFAVLRFSKLLRAEALPELRQAFGRLRPHLPINGAPPQFFTINSIFGELKEFDLYIPNSISIWRENIEAVVKDFMDSRKFKQIDLIFRDREYSDIEALQGVRSGGDVQLKWRDPGMPPNYKHGLPSLGGESGDHRNPRKSNFTIEWRECFMGLSHRTTVEFIDDIFAELLNRDTVESMDRDIVNDVDDDPDEEIEELVA